MKSIALTALIVGLSGLPLVASAQAPPATKSLACRPAKAGETANGTFQNTPQVCHTVDVAKIHDAMMAVMNDNLTADQKAKLEQMMGYISEEMMLDPRYPGFNGNPNNP